MSNISKHTLIESLIRQEVLNLLTEGASETYDKLIKTTLKSQEVPTPVGTYILGADGRVNSKDLENFKALYRVAPSKAGKEDSGVGSKGSGHGEVAMYWLLSKKYEVLDGRGGGKPDLIVNGTGVEVKSYEESRMTLGRIGSDKTSAESLNTLFGLDTLVSSLKKGKEKKRQATALTFNKAEIIDAFATLRDFSANEKLRDVSRNIDIIGNIYSRVDNVLSTFNLEHDFDPEEAAGALVKQLVLNKLGQKPGAKPVGYIVNVSEEGKIDYTKITVEKIESLDPTSILDSASLNQGQLVMDISVLK